MCCLWRPQTPANDSALLLLVRYVAYEPHWCSKRLFAPESAPFLGGHKAMVVFARRWQEITMQNRTGTARLAPPAVTRALLK